MILGLQNISQQCLLNVTSLKIQVKFKFTCSIITSSIDCTKEESSVSKLIITIIITGLSLSITHCEMLTGAHILFFIQYLVTVSANLNDGCISEHFCL